MNSETTFDGTYPFAEFCDHFDELQHGDYFGRDRSKVGSDDDACFEKSIIVVMEYMRKRYPDEREAFFKGSRYMMVLNFLAHHLHDFDTSDYAVYGSATAGALTSEHLLRAIHHFYTSPKLISDNKEPTPAEVMAMADSFRDAE